MTVDELVATFLAGHKERTARAYADDLDAFARTRGMPRGKAVAALLALGPEERRLELLRFVCALRKAGRAKSTINRRLYTLLALVRLAHDRGVITWHVDLTDWSPAALAEVEGRRPGAEVYALPRHPTEMDRLDLQHYALAEALGAHYLAPVDHPARVLDSGAGTGQWGIDFISHRRPALMVGFDLVAPKPEVPAGYHAVRGDVLQGLPFAPAAFDFVHQRLLIAGIPLEAWPGVVRDLARTCRPGGWVELVEGESRFLPVGPAMQRLQEMGARVFGDVGLDNESRVFASLARWLGDAGLVNVQYRELKLPLGEWGGQLGQMMAADVRSIAQRMGPIFAERLGTTPEEHNRLVAAACQEWDELHTTYALVVAWGRKPE